MEMTLEGGFTLQRTLPRRVAGWITIAEGVGWNGETENADTIFFAFSHFFVLLFFEDIGLCREKNSRGFTSHSGIRLDAWFGSKIAAL